VLYPKSPRFAPWHVIVAVRENQARVLVIVDRMAVPAVARSSKGDELADRLAQGANHLGKAGRGKAVATRLPKFSPSRGLTAIGTFTKKPNLVNQTTKACCREA